MNVAFVGDVMLGRMVNEVLRGEVPEYPWGDTLDIFSQADFRICNLECVLSNVGEPWTSKVFHFCSDSKNIEVLKAASINAVSLANNHVLDYGYEAMFDMLDLLEDSDVWYAGAGRNWEQASSVVIPEVHIHTKSRNEHYKLGIMAFTDNEPGWEARKDKPGVNYVPVDVENEKAKLLFQQIKEAKLLVDILIISAHLGGNWGYRPEPNHIIFSKALIDAGADLVFGHSPHVFQGIEIYKSRPIIYSAGNFIDDYAVDEIEKNDQSFIFVTETEGKKIVGLKLYPTVIRNMQANKAKMPERKEIMLKMVNLCGEFGTKTHLGGKSEFLEIPVQ